MKTIFLTGGNGDIGKAISYQFMQQGWTVLSPTREELDLTELSNLATYIEMMPKISSFVHCAGINNPVQFKDLELSNLEKTLEINSLAFYKIVHQLVVQDKINFNGHILGISSIYGLISRKGRFAYTASKYCLNGMIKNLSIELGEKRVKVNGLAPGFVNTKLTKKNNPKDVLQKLEKAIPLGFLADVEDIAKVAYFLASSENNYISGQVIVADGGYTIGGFSL